MLALLRQRTSFVFLSWSERQHVRHPHVLRQYLLCRLMPPVSRLRHLRGKLRSHHAQFAHRKKVFTLVHSPAPGPYPHEDTHIAFCGGETARMARITTMVTFLACLLGIARFKKTFEKLFLVGQSVRILHIEQMSTHSPLCEALLVRTYMATMTLMVMEEKISTAWMWTSQKRTVYRVHLLARLLRRLPSTFHCRRLPLRLATLPLGVTRVPVIRPSLAAERPHAPVLRRSRYKTRIWILRERVSILKAG